MIPWQTIVVLLVIGLACLYLARAAWHSVVRKKAGTCGACSTCPANGAAGEPEVVHLGNGVPRGGRQS